MLAFQVFTLVIIDCVYKGLGVVRSMTMSFIISPYFTIDSQSVCSRDTMCLLFSSCHHSIHCRLKALGLAMFADFHASCSALLW